MKVLKLEEFRELVDCVAEEIRQDYEKIEENYHWPERKLAHQKKCSKSTKKQDKTPKNHFKNFQKTVGFKETFDLRMQTPKLWEALNQQDATSRIKITETEYFQLIPNLSTKKAYSNEKSIHYPKLLSDPKVWFARLIIAKWGGVGSNDYDKLEDYVEQLTDLHKMIIEGNIDLYDSSLYEPFGNGVSSWSKLLSFSLPKYFVIYDTRVAYRLDSIIAKYLNSRLSFLKNSPFYLDRYRVSGSDGKKPLTEELNSQFIGGLKGTSVSNSYAIYLRLVDELTKKFKDSISLNEDAVRVKHKIEMTLFTTGRIADQELNSQYFKELNDPTNINFKVWEKKNSNNPCKTGYESLVQRLLKDLNR